MLGFLSSQYCKVNSKLTYVSALTVGWEAGLASVLRGLVFRFECLWMYFEGTNIKFFAGKLFAK